MGTPRSFPRRETVADHLTEFIVVFPKHTEADFGLLHLGCCQYMSGHGLYYYYYEFGNMVMRRARGKKRVVWGGGYAGDRIMG